MNFWRGSEYGTPSNEILVLGESSYGNTGPIDLYVRTWISGAGDPTFSRIFSSCSGKHRDFATKTEQGAFWNRIAFYNFVVRELDSSKDRPKSADYLLSKKAFQDVLAELKPSGVWILGVEQSVYSAPLVEEYGAVCEVARHPTSRGLKNEDLSSSWNRLVGRVSAQ